VNLNVFITRRTQPEALTLLQKAFEHVDLSDDLLPMPPDKLREAASGRDGLLIMGNDKADAALFDAAGPQLRAISNYSVGYNNIDIAEATRRRIVVTNTPGVLDETTADLTWALMLAVGRRLIEADKFARSGEWRGWAPTQLCGADLFGKTLGIVGAGRIGAAVARRAAGFSMPVIYSTRTPKPELDKFGAKRVAFDELLRQSDFITVHVPLTPETKHMFGEKQFRAMKPTAFFINMARGPVHDEAALVRALQQRWIAGAGLDVYENEPQINPDLLPLANAVLLPHIGSATEETRRRMSIMTAENLINVLTGKPCPNIVNPEVLKP
jgi:glyoxylate reductase